MGNIDYGSQTFVNKQHLGKTQMAQSIRVSVRNEIVDVLSVGIDSNVTSYEIVGGEVTFYGKTTLKLLYSDGLSVQSANFSADFTSAITLEQGQNVDSVVFDVVTVDSSTETNANTATVHVLTDVYAWGFSSQNVTYAVGGDDVFVKTEQGEATTAVKVLDSHFTVEREFSSSKNISTVLLAESQLVVTSFSVEDNVLTCGGDGVARLTYMSEEEIVTDNFTFGWSRELDASGVDVSSQLYLLANVRATKVRLDISDSGDNTTFSVESQAVLHVQSSVTQPVEIVADMYAVDTDFTLNKQIVSTTLPCGSTREQTQLTYSVADGALAAVNLGAVATKCSSGEKRVTVEGYVVATLLYKQDGVFRGETVELPFMENFDVEYVGSECNCIAYPTVGEAFVEESNTLKVQMWMQVFCSKNQSLSLITDVEQQAIDRSESCAIEVCLAKKGDTLWNLAKNLHMSEDDLLATNPQLTNPLEEDTKVVVFNKL